MRNFQEKRKSKYRIRPLYISVLLVIIILFFAWGMYGFTGKMLETTKNKKIAEDKIAELQNEKEKFSTDIAKLKTSEGIEESIREKFGWAKEGEGMVVVVDDGATEQTPKETKDQGFLSFLKNWFK